MPRRPFRQPLSGFTLIELIVGVAIMSIISLVLAGLLRAGLRCYRSASGAQFVLLNARRSLWGDGPAAGIVADARAASAAAVRDGGLSFTEPASDGAVAYDVLNGRLWRSSAGIGKALADGARAVRPAYFKLDAQGRIVPAAWGDSPLMTTVLVTISSPDGKTRDFFAGAKLRNAP